jgi:hypothetical protein
MQGLNWGYGRIFQDEKSDLCAFGIKRPVNCISLSEACDGGCNSHFPKTYACKYLLRVGIKTMKQKGGCGLDMEAG